MRSKNTKPLFLGTAATLLLVGLLALTIVIISNYESQEPEPLSEINYKGMVMLGVYPNSQSRQPFSDDINTGLTLVDPQGKKYILYESTHLETKDLGKTFVWGVS